MPLMAEQHASGTTESARDWSLRLLGAGLSLLPVGYGKDRKSPLGALLPEDEQGKRIWGCFSQAPPDPDTVTYWFSKRPDAGIGVVCGAVSGGLQVLDIDDGLFARWLSSRLGGLGPLAGTWSVRTGSGKLHVYLRSGVALGPGEHRLIDSRDGRRLADIRDEGSYVVAPPSRSDKGPYVTFRGSPESIVRVVDALRVWHALAAAYARNGHHEPRPEVVEEVSGAIARYARNVRPPADGAELARIQDLVNRLQAARARKTIADPNPSWPGWDGKDYSDLDWRVVKEILQAGGSIWSDADFEAVWASFAIGEHCYRNLERPNHGAAYLLGQTLPRAREAYETERKAAESAAGHNFAVSAVKKILYEPPIYELSLERTDVEPHKTYSVTVSEVEIGNERSFILSVFRQTNWIMQPQGAHQTPNGYRQFLQVIGSVTQEIEPPEGATDKGQLWVIVRRAIIDRLAGKEVRPDKVSEIRFGWHEGEVAFISSSALMAHLRQEQKRPPNPRDVWSVLEARGAKSKYVRLGGQREEMWELKVDALA